MSPLHDRNPTGNEGQAQSFVAALGNGLERRQVHLLISVFVVDVKHGGGRCARSVAGFQRRLWAESEPALMKMKKLLAQSAPIGMPFRSVAELEKAIHTYIAATNAAPKPFRWTKTADNILASIQRFCLRTLAATK